MAHRPMPMLHEPRPMAQGPMPERAKLSRSSSWPGDGLSTSDGSDVIDYGICRGDDDSCSKGDIRDGNSVDRGICDDGDGCVGEGSDGSDVDGIVYHGRYQRRLKRWR